MLSRLNHEIFPSDLNAGISLTNSCPHLYPKQTIRAYRGARSAAPGCGDYQPTHIMHHPCRLMDVACVQNIVFTPPPTSHGNLDSESWNFWADPEY